MATVREGDGDIGTSGGVRRGRSEAAAGRSGDGRVADRPHAGGPFAAVFALQRQAGNRALRPFVQTKLRVSRPGDPYEREAERVADEVMRMPAETATHGAEGVAAAPAVTPVTRARGGQPPVQRCPGCGGTCCGTAGREEDEDERFVQRRAIACAGGAAPSPADAAARIAAAERAGGRPLSPSLRAFFEPRYGRDFGRVRVHTGGAAYAAAAAVRARAYTRGRNIVFGAGQWAPHTMSGRHLLAHELAHVVQQGGASSGEPVIQRDADPEAEAEASSSTDAQRSAERAAPDFGDVSPDAACPSPPTYLGRRAPEPPCPESDEEITGERFHFCLGSDVFSPGDERQRLIRFARSRPARAEFTVHGYASREGGTTHNLNLSCHRAKRVARELVNAGVRPERVRIAAKGETGRFEPEPADRAGRRPGWRARLAANRVAVIRATAPGDQPAAVPARAERRALVDAAVARIERGAYRLAADAYLSLWSCGRIPSFAEAVRRTTIRIEGDGPYSSGGVNRLGDIPSEGRNEIILSDETFDEAADPLSCVMARIMDMSFHHMVDDVIASRRDQHRAALFAVELAGLPPCETPAQTAPGDPSLVMIPRSVWWTRPARDPRAGLRPPCADAPLPGAIQPQPGPRTPPGIPTFTVSNFLFQGGQGAARWAVHPRADTDPNWNISRVVPPRDAFRGLAEVSAAGDPAEVDDYVVGFIQTIVADEEIVEYVAGHRVELALPIPMRDGPPRRAAPPPWYWPQRAASFAAPGTPVRTIMADGPSMSLPYHYIDVARLGRASDDADTIEYGNALNRARRRTVFHTWLVARHRDAPLDRFSTRFLDGRIVEWSLEVDVTGRDGVAEYRANVSTGPPTDTTPMQLRGPTPAELATARSPFETFRTLRTVRTVEPQRRSQAGGVGLNAYRDRVRDVNDDLEPLRRTLGLTGRMTVWIRIDPDTGRIAIGTERRPAVTVEEAEDEGVGEAARGRYARELLIRLRKDLVLAPLTGRFSGLERIPIVLRPLGSGSGSRNPDPYAPEHGIGLAHEIAETVEAAESRRRLRQNPAVYDPDLVPEVDVVPQREEYLYDFRVPYLNIDIICEDQSMHTQGCVVPDITGRMLRTESWRVGDIRYLRQSLNGVEYNSPVAVEIRTFPARFTMYVPRERVDSGGTFNHELHHIVANHSLMNIFKERLARRVRLRLRQARRRAADHPELRAALLAPETIAEIVRQEARPLHLWFNTAYTRRHDPIDSGRPLRTLTESEIRRFWTDFRMPRRIPDARGTFTP